MKGMDFDYWDKVIPPSPPMSCLSATLPGPLPFPSLSPPLTQLGVLKERCELRQRGPENIFLYIFILKKHVVAVQTGLWPDTDVLNLAD